MSHSKVASSLSTAPSHYRWWVVFMLWWVCFFNYADRQAIYSVFPTLETEFGFSKFELGLIGSAFMWVYAGGAPFAGWIGDRVRRKDLILGGCLFWSFVTLLTAGCSRLWQFVTVRALEGFGETFYFPASMALVSDYHTARTRSRAMALHQSSVYIGTIGGSWAGAWFAETMGWRVGFWFFGGMGILLALVLYHFLDEPKRGAAEGPADPAQEEPPLSVWETARMIAGLPTVWCLMLAFVAANFVATIFLTWTPTFLKEKFDFKLAAAGFSGTVFIHLASAVSAPFAGWLADVLTRRYAWGRMAIQAAGVLIGAAFVFVVGQTDSVTTLLTAMTAFGICKGFYDSGIFASLYDVVPARARATTAGLMNTVGWGGGALGPLFVGWATEFGGQDTEVANMSDAIAWGGAVYLVAAAWLILAMIFHRK